VAGLLGSGLLTAPERLVWTRPRLGQIYGCVVTDDARLHLDDGRVFTTPSGAAIAAADVIAYDGWHAWRIESRGGVPLDQLLEQFASLDAGAAEASNQP
jgi:hypothetical protein